MSNEVGVEDIRIISEETRMKIIMLLSERVELGLNDISKLIGKAKSTTSEHLKILMENGVIEREQTERGYIYKLSDKGKRIMEMMRQKDWKVSVEKKAKWSISDSAIIKILTPTITGLSMWVLSGIPMILMILSIINGIIFGLMKLGFKEVVEGGVIFSCIITIIIATRLGIMSIIPAIIITIIIYISLSGLTWIITRLLIKWREG
ncbi:MAG: winged helix-turn-helix domain-containing protein [Candidatus Methanomethylicia archaeon]